MSRSQKREGGASNPVQKFVTYRPNSGEFHVYDKSTKDKYKPESLDIIILDADRSSLSGYSSEHDAGIICNSVLNSKTEEMVVGVVSNGKYREVLRGLYQDIKNDIEGGKYTRDVYCLLVEDGNYSLANLQLTGMARGQFDDWFKDNSSKALESVITINSSEEVYNYVKKTKQLEVVPKSAQKRWRTTWLRTLSLDLSKISQSEDELAYSMDEKLQEYLSGESKPKEVVAEPEPVSVGGDDESDDLPF